MSIVKQARIVHDIVKHLFNVKVTVQYCNTIVFLFSVLFVVWIKQQHASIVTDTGDARFQIQKVL